MNEFDQIIQHFQATLDKRLTLSKQDQLLLPLIPMVIQGIDVREQVNKALKEVEPPKISALLMQLEPVVGCLKVEKALKEAGLDGAITKHEDPHFGRKVQQEIYGTEIRQLLSSLPDGLGDVVADSLSGHFFDDYYRDVALTVQEREKYTLMALICLNVELQINAHALGSLKAGNQESNLIQCVIFLLPYIGFPYVINSIQKIHQAALKLGK